MVGLNCQIIFILHRLLEDVGELYVRFSIQMARNLSRLDIDCAIETLNQPKNTMANPMMKRQAKWNDSFIHFAE